MVMATGEADVSALLPRVICPVLVMHMRGAELMPVPAGIYLPLFRGENDLKEIPVARFLLASTAVTNGEFLEFVRANPQWQRSGVKRLFADDGYLQQWSGDTELGTRCTDCRSRAAVRCSLDRQSPAPRSSTRFATISCSPIWGTRTSGTPRYRLSLTLFMPPCDTKTDVRRRTSSCGTHAHTMKLGGGVPRLASEILDPMDMTTRTSASGVSPSSNLPLPLRSNQTRPVIRPVRASFTSTTSASGAMPR